MSELHEVLSVFPIIIFFLFFCPCICLHKNAEKPLLEWCRTIHHCVFELSVRVSVHEHILTVCWTAVSYKFTAYGNFTKITISVQFGTKINRLNFEVNTSKVKVTSRLRTTKQALCEAFYHLSPECTRSTPHKADDIFKSWIHRSRSQTTSCFFSTTTCYFWMFSASRGLWSVSDTNWDCNLQLPAIFVYTSL